MKKNTISNYMKGIALSVSLILASSCDLQNHLQDPSALNPDQAGNEFIFNGIQLSFNNFYYTATQFGADNTRMLAMFGATYENSYTANSFNTIWYNAYSDFLVNANLLLAKTTEDPATTTTEYNAYYQGATKTLKAYVLMTLVDYFGDVPFSQALDPSNYFPTTDDDAVIYGNVLTLLDEAITDLGAVGSSTIKPGQDMYYGGDENKWRKFAKTLKFKLFLQRRLVDQAGSTAGMAALIADNDMISGTSNEFAFRYSANSQSNPNTYHPWFFQNYQTSTGQYMSNSYMKELFDAKTFLNTSVSVTPVTVRDPRIRFYFYRQVTSPTSDVNDLTCSTATSPPAHYPPGTAYCQLPAGYWGRDHLNFEGTPPDGLKKTTYGLYPAGGKFDASNALPVDEAGALTAGGAGKGIMPIMMSSFVKFMRAEYELMLNNDPAAARIELLAGINESIARVVAFNPAVTPSTGAVANTFNAAAITAYVNAVLLRYDNGVEVDYAGAVANATTDEKLDVIVKEYWVALWGNGVEAYNTVRRTGKPSNLQPALAPNPGEFYRSFTYPAVYVIRNNNAVQKAGNTVQVFWDTNPAGFIN